jgi:hypothetical protein
VNWRMSDHAPLYALLILAGGMVLLVAAVSAVWYFM